MESGRPAFSSSILPMCQNHASSLSERYTGAFIKTEDIMQHTFESWITPLMIGGLMLFMSFIIWDLARKSKAGKFGTLMLFIVLGAGMLGYLFKVVITYLMERGGGI